MNKEELVEELQAPKETSTQKNRRLKEEARAELKRKSLKIIEKDYNKTTNKKGIDSGIVRKQRKIGRNESCPCGSGIKYKNCHLNKDLDLSTIK